ARDFSLGLFSGTIDPVHIFLGAGQKVTGSQHRLARYDLGSKRLRIVAQASHAPHKQRRKPYMEQRECPEPIWPFRLKHVMAKPKKFPASEQAREVTQIPRHLRERHREGQRAYQAAV